ncbi:Retrovirus-related Pol polyprotein from transposon opus [Araneus ventricosus]|uniref:Retrovirus-related Pol polyprotein from transposon opus n=1 Tax=Araneus ventricosus TaxID=182803 RepID=A0A4Y2HAC5_ARAVE|nr:Retrovirus-related Pol polyprotein from transposon opus [Araneus ventricosus]
MLENHTFDTKSEKPLVLYYRLAVLLNTRGTDVFNLGLDKQTKHSSRCVSLSCPGKDCLLVIRRTDVDPHTSSQVSLGGVSPLPDRVKALTEYPLPKSVAELRRFLAMINFYHRFLKNAAGTQACLHDLVKGRIEKDKTPIIRTDETKEAFRACKELLKDAAMLAYPKHNTPLSLITDASETAILAVLQQHAEGGTEPLGFFPRKLNTAERKYSTYDRELLAIYSAISPPSVRPEISE